MQNYKNIFFLGIMYMFQHQAIFGAAPELRLMVGVEQDELIQALLAGDDIEDVEQFWHDNVEQPLAAEIDTFGIAIITTIANRIKENILVAFLPTAGISHAVTNEIERLRAEGADLVFAPLPPAIQNALDTLVFLTDEEQASLSFSFNNMLVQGATEAIVLARINTIGNEYAANNTYQPIAIDGRIYGIADFIEQPAHVLPAPPKILTQRQFKRIKQKMHKKFIRLQKNVVCTTPLPCIPIQAPADAETICLLCTQESVLYKNACTACTTDDIALCRACITRCTVQDIIGRLAFESADDTGPVHIDFSLKLPRCPFCKTPYYNETNFNLLEQALPIRKRRILIIEALTQALEKIPAATLPNLLARLIASSVPLQNIQTHRPNGTLVPLRIIALQIYEHTASMHECMREPFTNTAVWLE